MCVVVGGVGEGRGEASLPRPISQEREMEMVLRFLTSQVAQKLRRGRDPYCTVL